MADLNISGRILSGLAAPYYDGTKGSQYELFAQTYERYMPGAFDQAIKSSDTRLLWNHDANFPLARTTSHTLQLSASKRGLEVSATLNRDSQWASELAMAIRRGDVSGMSIGMIVRDELWRRDGKLDIREIHQVDLFDVSVVTFPAYEATSVAIRTRGTTVRDMWDRRQDSKRVLVTAFESADRKMAFDAALATLSL